MGALLLTPCFLALPLAVLPLLLPHLLAFLLPDLLALQALLLLSLPLLLRSPCLLLPLLLVGSRISLRWVRSTIHAVLPLVGFARSRSSCSQRGTGATLRPPVRRATLGGHDTSSAYYRTLMYVELRISGRYIRKLPHRAGARQDPASELPSTRTRRTSENSPFTHSGE